MAPIIRSFFLALIALAAGLETASAAAAAEFADVVSVKAAGRPGAYTFAVGVRSPDKGCTRYADWWEVLDTSGRLLYRRVLMHSHVAEQPFERSGGPVAVQRDEVVFVRAHMNPGGYGGKVLTGSVAAGFRAAKGTASLPDHSRAQPLPDGCAF